MSDEIRVALLSALITMLTFFLSSLLQIYRDGRHLEQERFMKVLEYKVDTYRKIYKELLAYKNYFLLFVDTANEFKENEEEEKFAPLENNMNFRKAYDKYRLFFSKELDDKLCSALEGGETLNNLAISLCNHTNEQLFIESVCPSCKRVIDKIDACIFQIKKELYIEK